MEHKSSNQEITVLEQRMKELLAQSDEIQRQIDNLSANRAAVGVVDDTRILAGGDSDVDSADF